MTEQQEDFKACLLHDLAAYRKTGMLRSHLTMMVALEGARHPRGGGDGKRSLFDWSDIEPVVYASRRIHAAIKVFEGARWFWGGLQEKVLATDDRFLEGVGEGWSLRLGSMAGRCMLTLTDLPSKEWVSMVTADDEKAFTQLEWGNMNMGPMGFQGIEAKEETALQLLRRATMETVALAPTNLAFG